MEQRWKAFKYISSDDADVRDLGDSLEQWHVEDRADPALMKGFFLPEPALQELCARVGTAE